MRQAFNPTRRNRNIGTAKQGHGASNRLCIPSVCGLDRTWWEQIGSYDLVEKIVADRTVRFIIDQPKPGTVHACSVDDVCALLELVPKDDWRGMECFVFRQPTRKQRLLSPVWGRLSMYAEIGQAGKPHIHTGPAILIDVIDSSLPISWGRSLDPEATKELERLQMDGHTIVENRRGYQIVSDRNAIRATQLYRTIPHEIGHWVDWLERVERPSERPGSDYSKLADGYWARASSEREAFAHSYADGLRGRLMAVGGTSYG